MLFISNSSVLSSVAYIHSCWEEHISFANCVTLVRDDEEFSFAIKVQKKRNHSTGNLNANGPCLLMAALLKLFMHVYIMVCVFPLFWVRMCCSNSRGCGCLIPSLPSLPFAWLVCALLFPTSFCPLSSVHDVQYDFRENSCKKLG